MKLNQLNYLGIFLAATLIMLSSCGVIKDTYEGMTDKEKTGDQIEEQSNEMIVEVFVESDGVR